MPTSNTAKIFNNGNSQAVRLPKQFRIDANEVFIRKDASNGDIVLSLRPAHGGWADFFSLRDKFGDKLRDTAKPNLHQDFMHERPMNTIVKPSDPFGQLPPTALKTVKPVGKSRK
jgi:virulence-associated protein VagC